MYVGRPERRSSFFAGIASTVSSVPFGPVAGRHGVHALPPLLLVVMHRMLGLEIAEPLGNGDGQQDTQGDPIVMDVGSASFVVTLHARIWETHSQFEEYHCNPECNELTCRCSVTGKDLDLLVSQHDVL